MQTYLSAIIKSWMALHIPIITCSKAMQKVMATKTHYTGSEDSNTMAPSGMNLYHLLFLVLAVEFRNFWIHLHII
jgi:hypothetical protein